MAMNEKVELATLANNVKKKVNGLIGVYALLIIGTILLFLIVTGIVILLEWAMFSEGTVYGRAVVLGIMVILAAGYCLVIVLKPIFKIFEKPKRKGTEIKREDYPDLFGLIDEVVKEVDCLQPKHVRVSNECNAYVFHSNLLGYIRSGSQNLTIGLPLLYAMNKTEMKAILAHEFGHFTQKSVSTNRVANLSEFICASIARAEQEIENEDENSVARWARGFARLAGKIMAGQYHKIAPLNGVLSRAQEFDADHFSQLIAGTDGSISALCKLDHMSDRWNEFYSMLVTYQKEKEWAPDDVHNLFGIVSRRADTQSGLEICPQDHLSKPVDRLTSRITSADMDDTHPSIEERLKAIRSYPEIDTLWDDSPALDYFQKSLISNVFNETTDEIKQLVYPYSTVFLKKSLTAEEMDKQLDNSSPGYIDEFGKYRLFFSEETDMSGDKGPHSEYEVFPFTKENARLLEEYYIAEDDLLYLRSVAEEASPKTKFCYLGKTYDGTNAPVSEQEAYFEPLKEKAISVARHCNWWLDRKAEEKDKVSLLKSFRISAMADLSLRSLDDAMRTVYSIIQTKPSEGRLQYISKVENIFKERSASIMSEDVVGSVFDIVARENKIDEKDAQQVKSYFSGEAADPANMIQAFVTLGQNAYSYSESAWNQVERTLFFDREETTEEGIRTDC